MANAGGFLAMLLKNLYGFGGVFLIKGEHHADAHVEDVEHLTVWNFAILFEKTEHRKYLPAAFLHLYTLPFMEDSWNVLIETTTGDMRYSMDIHVTDYVKHRFHIDASRS